MKKNLKIVSASLLATFLPIVAFAQGTVSVFQGSQCAGGSQTLCTVIARVIGYLNQALVLLMGVAVVMFVWYVIKYYIRPNENRSEGGKYILYSVIGFFVILSMWGIVNVLQNTFGLQNSYNQYRSWADFSTLFPTR